MYQVRTKIFYGDEIDVFYTIYWDFHVYFKTTLKSCLPHGHTVKLKGSNKTYVRNHALSIPMMKKSILFPIFKFYCYKVHLWIAFTFRLKKKKLGKVYNTIFKTLNIRQQVRWSPRDRQRQGVPCDSPTSCLE